MDSLPKNFQKIQNEYAQVVQCAKELGEATSQAGPIDEKTSHLIQLAAATALGSEGAVHSHTKRALGAGATPKEIEHTIVLLTPTIGFPTVAAALSWAWDVID